MRITNKIIQNNSLTNINTNKTLQDKLSNMISSEKKINRPSDDPIIALRSLRLRTSVNQTDQFLNKNVEDAKSWLTVTEDSIDTLSDIITDIRKQYTKGTSDTLTASDRKIILENLESLAAEVYNTGNADFAGRSVFTGYRTDTTLTVQKDSSYLTTDVIPNGVMRYSYQGADVEIKFVNVPPEAQGSADNFRLTGEAGGSRVSYDVFVFQPTPGYSTGDYMVEHPNAVVYDSDTQRVYYGANVTLESEPKLEYSDSVFNITENMDSLTVDNIKFVHKDETDETKVSENEIMRVRLSYDKLSSVSFKTDSEVTDPDKAFKLYIKTKDGSEASSYQDINGTGTLEVVTISSLTETDESLTPPVYSPYEYVMNNPDKAVFVPETGEILLGKDAMGNGTELSVDNIEDISVDYQKGEWNKGDLRPQHYFKCTDVTNNLDPIKYNYDTPPEGEICYNIGVNQSLRINTVASECFNHDIVRDIDDVIRALRNVETIETEIFNLQKEHDAIDEADTAARDAVQVKIDAAKKAQTFLINDLHDLFSKGISKADGYLEANNIALTNCGTRSKRLDLIENRLATQLDTLKELKSDNEDADMAETAIRLSSAKYAYDASLMATSKSIQQSLLNYL